MHYLRKLGIAVLAIMLAIFLVPGVLAAATGASTAAGTPETRGFFAVTDVTAVGGAMTNLNASAKTQTVSWQGFFGEVLGNITLSDASGNTLFDWVNATDGIVMASRDGSVDFTSISAQNNCTIDEDLTGTRSDRINNTFTESNNTAFSVGTTSIAAGSACATHTYINSSAQNNNFEEIILTDDGGTTSIYTTRIEEDLVGFDNQPHDFQMIVPETRNSSTSTYFFYAELQ